MTFLYLLKNKREGKMKRLNLKKFNFFYSIKIGYYLWKTKLLSSLHFVPDSSQIEA